MLNVNALPDLQNSPDTRKIPIDKVGIKDMRYPLSVATREGGVQHTVADVNMYVSLPQDFKGTHMSRFVSILNEFKGELEVEKISQLLNLMKHRLNASATHLEISFPYFINKAAPVSGELGLMEYKGGFKATLDQNDVVDLILQVLVPVTTLCPCSKEISSYGAHNQRSWVTINARPQGLVWLEELIDIVEANGSCPVYSMVKRVDEKFITEKAYDNPKFVEDVVRDITLILMNDPRILWFTVESDNDELIHNHNAYAYIEKDKRN